jgi:hypothetical protein
MCVKTKNYPTRLLSYLTAALLFIPFFAQAQTGVIRGVVKDRGMNQTLPGASVIVEGTSIGTSTDFNGEFELKSLKPGVHNIVVSFISYGDTRVERIEVGPGKETSITIELEPADVKIDAVNVEARVQREKESVLLLEQKRATAITQQIGAQELSRKGAGDVAAAVTKVTGVTKREGSSDIFVRGLGDRYNSTSLNGLPVPSDNAENKNINLSLFTTDIVEYISIDKVYNSGIYGDFAGGNVDITTISSIDKDFVNIDLGAAANTSAIGRDDFMLGQGNSYMGFTKIEKPATISNFDFKNSMQPVKRNPYEGDARISAGKKLTIARMPLTIFGTAGFGNDYAVQEGISKSVNSVGYASKDLSMKNFKYTTNSTGLLSLCLRPGEKSKIRYVLLAVNTSDQAREEYSGTLLDIANSNNGKLTRNTYEQNTLLVNQLLGDYKINRSLDMDWGISYSTIKSETPDRIQNTFRKDLTSGQWHFGQNQITDNHRYFHKLEDRAIAANFKIDYKFAENEELGKRGKLSVGLFALKKERSFEATQYNYRILDKHAVIDPSGLDNFFTEENLQAERFTIETFRGNKQVPFALNPQVYSGNQFIPGSFLSLEYKISPKFTAIIGARLELVSQEVSWNTQLDPRDRSDKIEKLEILPSITTKYELTEKQNLRMGASKTYTLPQFKERALYIYEDVTQVKTGNADLYASENYNADLKWELFPTSGELFAIGIFGKYITNPINEIKYQSASGDITSANTGAWGYAAGIEAEMRKEILSLEKSKLLIGLNAAYMKTDQELDQEKIAKETRFKAYFTNTSGSFTGASDFLANADLSFLYDFNREFADMALTAAYGYKSESIYAIGTNDGGDLIDKPVATLDFIAKLNFGKYIGMGMGFKNLLNPSIDRVQQNKDNDVLVNSYKRGRSLSLSVSFKF